MDDTTEAVSRQSLWRAAEPLWIAALGAQFIVLGGLLLPRLIRLVGRGGAAESVEWGVYMSTLFVFPVAVWITGWVIPRASGEWAGLLRRSLVSLLVIEFVVYAVLRATPSLLAAAILASIATVSVPYFRSRFPSSNVAVVGACALASWMAAGGLVYWGDARQWLSASVLTIATLVAALVFVGAMLRDWITGRLREGPGVRVLDLVPLGILILFSFRTFPVVEFYHWGFFVGPIEQLRQGGTLLWDTPSQYGLWDPLESTCRHASLSIL